jgi:hypothetical protein
MNTTVHWILIYDKAESVICENSTTTIDLTNGYKRTVIITHKTFVTWHEWTSGSRLEVALRISSAYSRALSSPLLVLRFLLHIIPLLANRYARGGRTWPAVSSLYTSNSSPFLRRVWRCNRLPARVRALEWMGRGRGSPWSLNIFLSFDDRSSRNISARKRSSTKGVLITECWYFYL